MAEADRALPTFHFSSDELVTRCRVSGTGESFSAHRVRPGGRLVPGLLSGSRVSSTKSAARFRRCLPSSTLRVPQYTYLRRSEITTATVNWFNDEKRYGFITSDDSGKDLFVHHSAIPGSSFKSLAEGAKVSYDAEPGPKGPAWRTNHAQEARACANVTRRPRCSSQSFSLTARTASQSDSVGTLWKIVFSSWAR